jgi:hypothetical protein
MVDQTALGDFTQSWFCPNHGVPAIRLLATPYGCKLHQLMTSPRFTT